MDLIRCECEGYAIASGREECVKGIEIGDRIRR